MTTLMSIIILLSSLSIIISVAMQDGQERGNATFIPSEPIWGPNQGRGKEFTLKRITVVSTVIFMVSTLGLLMIK
ncbi:MAG: preprotein translocase subunit SecG [Tissierellia bacterium]|nr:preprotein translocase subunit SecG [Tissierellia bacterium]